MNTISVDEASIQSMVEEYWRSFVAVAKNNPKVAREIAAKFDARMKIMADLIAPDQRQTFSDAVEESREALFTEYLDNPSAQKRRLGLPTEEGQSRSLPTQYGNRRQSISAMAVKTAIRATIWETVFSIFRAFR